MRQPLQSSHNSDTGATNSGRYTGDSPSTLTAAFIPVRQRNVEPISTVINQNVMAGDYYFSIEMGAADAGEQNFTAPLTIAVAVDGTATGAPKYAKPFKRAGDQAAKTSSNDGVPTGIWIGLAALAVIALAGAGFVIGRRSGTADRST